MAFHCLHSCKASEELGHPGACWGHQGRRKGAAVAYVVGDAAAAVGPVAYGAEDLLVAVGLLAAVGAAGEGVVDRGVAAEMGQPSEGGQSNLGLRGLH